MIWVIIVVILVIVLLFFLSSLNEDKNELSEQAVFEKFRFVVNGINQSAFNSFGKVNIIDNRSFNLYQEGQNQIISFHYSTGSLSITWKYKYYEKEVVHKKQFDNVRNLSIFEQQKIGKIMIQEMDNIVEKHKESVLAISESPSLENYEFSLVDFKVQIEASLRNGLNESLINAKGNPEQTLVPMIMDLVHGFSERLKGNYAEVNREFGGVNKYIGISEHDYKEVIDDSCTLVLKEFIV